MCPAPHTRECRTQVRDLKKTGSVSQQFEELPRNPIHQMTRSSSCARADAQSSVLYGDFSTPHIFWISTILRMICFEAGDCLQGRPAILNMGPHTSGKPPRSHHGGDGIHSSGGQIPGSSDFLRLRQISRALMVASSQPDGCLVFSTRGKGLTVQAGIFSSFIATTRCTQKTISITRGRGADFTPYS